MNKTLTALLCCCIFILSSSLRAEMLEPVQSSNIVHIQHVSDPVSTICALYKETGDIRLLEIIERVSLQALKTEQSGHRSEMTRHITEAIKNGVWWAGLCTLMGLWWHK